MFATITALVMAAGGLGVGTAALMSSRRTAASQRGLQTALNEQFGLVAREVVKHSTVMAAAQDMKASHFFSELAGRLDGLEIAASEQLITRDEVSAAFAELARIEEQRLRQQQSYNVSAPSAPAPQRAAAVPPAAAVGTVDPWNGQATTPTDPTTLIQEIAAMNERLKQRLQNVGAQG